MYPTQFIVYVNMILLLHFPQWHDFPILVDFYQTTKIITKNNNDIAYYSSALSHLMFVIFL